MQAGSAKYGITVHAKPKNGYLAIELPVFTPDELENLVEEIEHLSNTTCQWCGNMSASEAGLARGWGLKLCDHGRQRFQQISDNLQHLNPLRGMGQAVSFHAHSPSNIGDLPHTKKGRTDEDLPD